MASKILEISTTDNEKYTFYPITSGAVRYQVKAADRVRIALTPKPTITGNNCVEVVFGTFVNKQRVRIVRHERKVATINSIKDILSNDEFKGFWICWSKGIIRVGHEDKTIALVAWEDPEPFPIAYVGLSTLGSSGIWKIEGTPELYTPDRPAYIFQPVLEGSLEFEFRGPRDCHVVLASDPAVMENKYEVILGGWGNTKSAIVGKVEIKTPKLLNPEEFKKIVIEWRSGLVKVRDETNTVFMEWRDFTSFGISRFGVRTILGATGDWRISTITSGTEPITSE